MEYQSNMAAGGSVILSNTLEFPMSWVCENWCATYKMVAECNLYLFIFTKDPNFVTHL